MTRDRGEIHRQFTAVDEAYKAGDLAALRTALGNPPDFPNCIQPFELAVGDYPLEYAIYWSPLRFIETLLALGADPNTPDPAGFPSLIAALTSGRRDGPEFFPALNGGDAAILYCFVFLYIASRGSGIWSLDKSSLSG